MFLKMQNSKHLHQFFETDSSMLSLADCTVIVFTTDTHIPSFDLLDIMENAMGLSKQSRPRPPYKGKDNVFFFLMYTFGIHCEVYREAKLDMSSSKPLT